MEIYFYDFEWKYWLISVHPCDKEANGGCSHTCNKEGDKSSCACPEEYEMTDDGKTCKKIHPCDKDTKGGCDQTCTKDEENAICSCKPVDFKLGEDGKSCEIVHPCDKPTKGGCEQTCAKKGTEAICECTAPEFKLGGDEKSCDPGKSLQQVVKPTNKRAKIDKSQSHIRQKWEKFKQTVSNMGRNIWDYFTRNDEWFFSNINNDLNVFIYLWGRVYFTIFDVNKTS